MRSITAYRIENDQVIKVPLGRKAPKESYDAKVNNVPFEQRVLDTYRELESDGKLEGHFKNARQATFIRDKWREQLEQ